MSSNASVGARSRSRHRRCRAFARSRPSSVGGSGAHRSDWSSGSASRGACGAVGRRGGGRVVGSRASVPVGRRVPERGHDWSAVLGARTRGTGPRRHPRRLLRGPSPPALRATYLLASVAALALSATRGFFGFMDTLDVPWATPALLRRIGWCPPADPWRCARVPSALSTRPQSNEHPERNDDEPNPSPVYDPVRRRARDHRHSHRRHHVSGIDGCRQSGSARLRHRAPRRSPSTTPDHDAPEHHDAAAAEHAAEPPAATTRRGDSPPRATGPPPAPAATATDGGARTPDEPAAGPLPERQRRRQQRWAQ